MASSSPLISRMSSALDISPTRFVDIVEEHNGLDLFSSSTPFGLQAAHDRKMAKPGDLGLIVNVASGLQVACALYRF